MQRFLFFAYVCFYSNDVTQTQWVQNRVSFLSRTNNRGRIERKLWSHLCVWGRALCFITSFNLMNNAFVSWSQGRKQAMQSKCVTAVTLRSLLCFALSSIVVFRCWRIPYSWKERRGDIFWSSESPGYPGWDLFCLQENEATLWKVRPRSIVVMRVVMTFCSCLLIDVAIALATFIQNILSISFHTRPFKVSLFGSTAIIWVPLSSINWILVYSILFMLICKICSLSSAFHCVVTIQQSVFIKSGFLCLYYSIDQVNNLREIQAMRRLNPHGNVVDLKDIIL